MKKLFTLFAVAAMAFAAQANVLTVADAGYDGYAHPASPIYGLWVDTYGTIGQVIYPADMLTEMVGKEITELKFTTVAYWYENFGDPGSAESAYGAYISFENATIQLSLMVVEENEFATATAYEGAKVVATAVPVKGDDHMTFVLDEPFAYEGGNLLVECLVIDEGTYGTTYFFGADSQCQSCYYGYESWGSWVEYTDDFLPMATFTYQDGGAEPPVEPTVKTGAPVFNGYTTDGIHAYFVEIIPTEPSVIYYRVQYPDGTWTDWAEYEEILSFEGDGKYRVEAYAVAPGKLPSEEIAYEFVVAPVTGIDEMMNGKTVAGVRYYNMAGQEMSEANGLTIVVTTYTDGTTSAVKVMK